MLHATHSVGVCSVGVCGVDQIRQPRLRVVCVRLSCIVVTEPVVQICPTHRWRLSPKTTNVLITIARALLAQADSAAAKAATLSSASALSPPHASTATVLHASVAVPSSAGFDCDDDGSAATATSYTLVVAPVQFDMGDDEECAGVSPVVASGSSSGGGVAMVFLIPGDGSDSGGTSASVGAGKEAVAAVTRKVRYCCRCYRSPRGRN